MICKKGDKLIHIEVDIDEKCGPDEWTTVSGIVRIKKPSYHTVTSVINRKCKYNVLPPTKCIYIDGIQTSQELIDKKYSKSISGAYRIAIRECKEDIKQFAHINKSGGNDYYTEAESGVYVDIYTRALKALNKRLSAL